jgi:hypothetical protein
MAKTPIQDPRDPRRPAAPARVLPAEPEPRSRVPRPPIAVPLAEAVSLEPASKAKPLPPVEAAEPPAQPGPASVFPAVVDPKPEAVVITCGDPRFQSAFRQFIEGALGLTPGTYIPFTVAGGAGVFARPDTLPKEFKFMRDRIELLKRRFGSLKRVIGISHEDCAYYQELSQKAAWLGKPFHAHLPREDMKLVAQVYARSLAHLGMPLEIYYAQFVAGDPARVVIDRVE